MDEIDMLRRYAVRSAADAPPAIDVRARVLESIRHDRLETDWLAGSVRPLFFAAAASVLVAVCLGILAQQAIAEMQDPLMALFTPFLVALT